jgi:DNA helicase HerA-like ATPase
MSSLPSPRPDSRTTIIGTTGDGKTTAALWLLSQSDLSRPVVIFDYKRDPRDFIGLVRERAAKIVRPGWLPGKYDRGIYILRPVVDLDNDWITEVIWKTWQIAKGYSSGRVLFFDELNLVPRSTALKAVYEQGRSKGIQVITQTQEPVLIPRYVLSQASYFGIFQLVDRDRIMRVRDFVPIPKEFDLLRHEFYWYDVAEKKLSHIMPVPPGRETREEIAAQVPAPLWF